MGKSGQGSQEKCDIGGKELILDQPDNSNIRHTIAVMSGKGGVGKSSVSALLASSLADKGYKVGVLDADITGPSIPKLLGVKRNVTPAPMMEDKKIIPSVSKGGIKVISLNLLIPEEDKPVVWRGPLIAGAVKQFWSDVLWGELDYLVVDLPPGTGDVPLTVMQSLPLDGLVMVSSPQDLAVMVVKKAINMAAMLDIDILGLVENMCSFKCPECNQIIKLFGKEKGETVCKETGISFLGSLPLDPEISLLGDQGLLEDYKVTVFDLIPDLIEKRVIKNLS